MPDEQQNKNLCEEKIIDILYNYSDWLSDGFEWYLPNNKEERKELLHKFASEVINVVKNG